MSLHADLTPGARAHLERQKRIQTATSLTITVLLFTLVGIILALVTFLSPLKDDDIDITLTRPVVIKPPGPEPTPLNPTINRKPTPPSNRISRMIAAQTLSHVSVPIPDMHYAPPSLDFGSGDEFGDTDGIIDGKGFQPPGLPPIASKRCTLEDRLARLKEMGGTPECENAVVSALSWLQSQQTANGSWSANKHPAAMTGLALLCYLGHCETPASPDYGDTVSRGITYLVDLGMRNGGKLSENPSDKHWPYEHAIATYALAEASLLTSRSHDEIPNLGEVTRQAGQYIIDHQHRKSGGWDYQYDLTGGRGGDLSVTAWHVQALKACSHTSIPFKGLKEAMRKATQYVESLGNDSGAFGYTSRNTRADYATLTGAGALCLQVSGTGSKSQLRKAAKYIREHSLFDYHDTHSDLYGHYYEAQVMMNQGGNDWKWYNDLFRDQLVLTQLPNGSWPVPGSNAGGKIRAVAAQYTSNEVYRVCLNTLMLEVYYRYLPGTSSR